MSNTPGCAYTDGPQYVGCQVAEKGWPMPQAGGRTTRVNRKCPQCGKRHQNGCAKKSMRNKKNKKGGFLGRAIVPFGIFALQKRSQRRHRHKHSNKNRRYRKTQRR